MLTLDIFQQQINEQVQTSKRCNQRPWISVSSSNDAWQSSMIDERSSPDGQKQLMVGQVSEMDQVELSMSVISGPALLLLLFLKRVSNNRRQKSP